MKFCIYLKYSRNCAHRKRSISGLRSEGSEISMKREKTFFAKRFTPLRDRLGTSWMLLPQPQQQ